MPRARLAFSALACFAACVLGIGCAVADDVAVGSAEGAAASGGNPAAGGDTGDVAQPGTGAEDGPDDGRGCYTVTGEAAVLVGAAAAADEHALTFEATTASDTSWGAKGNEAVVLDVQRVGGEVLGQVVLHQGNAAFTYGMHAGALEPGDKLALRVSSLSAAQADKRVRVCQVKLASKASLGPMGEGLVNAPIFKWPVQKRFDDLPVLLGWSRAAKSYQAVYTNENGGTVKHCGGGAEGIQGEVARWGRAFDIEGAYNYGANGGVGSWGRCTGGRPVQEGSPRKQAAHPVFYYGDGHNRLYESRGGYGRDCGSAGAEKSDGDLAGWNKDNPGNEPEKDAGRVITLRPLPVDMDALGYGKLSGRREALADVYAPWLYRLTSLELAREGKIDGDKSRELGKYMYVDLHVADVDGSGDRECAFRVDGGFVFRVKVKGAAAQDGPQMTAAYFGGKDNVKRIAVPLDREYTPDDVTGFTFDAYDGDGMYLLELGDAFVVRPEGSNGAKLVYMHKGTTAIDAYVDDDNGGCTAGKNSEGPRAGFAYPCVGGQIDIPR